MSQEIADLEAMCRHQAWATGDPLGLGGLLFDAHRMLQLMAGGSGFDNTELLLAVLQSARAGLEFFLAEIGWERRAEERLAFREFGLSIGLHAVPAMRAILEEIPDFNGYDTVDSHLNGLMSEVGTAKTIEAFWLDPANRKCAGWQGHEDINLVMLATSLAPAGFLKLHLPSPAQKPGTTAHTR
ncbi:MAG: hypothetical protein OER56_00180 [Hyphomicrobiales bacterium]|nr:hypothetical protein [Hyphomicrobiales bacterium]